MSKLFKVATWNVNSLKVRLAQILEWIAQQQPNLLALQETKLENKNFPLQAFADLGYQVACHGQKIYNGVAIISPHPLYDIQTSLPNDDDPQCRILMATIQNIRIINLYVPNGAAVASEKYHYKLHWLKQMTDYLKQTETHYPNRIVLGDLNIAPDDRDVYGPINLRDQILISALERQAFAQLLNADLQDSFRIHHTESGHYSWWDYRLNAFKRNHGFRIDHILSSRLLSRYCAECTIDKTVRTYQRPSDHAPVIACYRICD